MKYPGPVLLHLISADFLRLVCQTSVICFLVEDFTTTTSNMCEMNRQLELRNIVIDLVIGDCACGLWTVNTNMFS